MKIIVETNEKGTEREETITFYLPKNVLQYKQDEEVFLINVSPHFHTTP